jgi:hypothetical protein
VRAGLLVALVLAPLFLTPRANATAIAVGSLQLQSLAITPVSGSVMFSPTADAFAQAQNSLGEGAYIYSTDGTLASAAVTWANASGVASANGSSYSGSVGAGVDIPGEIDAAALSEEGHADLIDYSFALSNAGSVTFSAILVPSQSLTTDANGIQASSEVTFSLSLYSNTGGTVASNLLYFDSLLSVGPSGSLLMSPVQTPISNSVSLDAGSYSAYLSLDAEASAVNTVPEPSTFALLLGGALFEIARRARSMRS